MNVIVCRFSILDSVFFYIAPKSVDDVSFSIIIISLIRFSLNTDIPAVGHASDITSVL